MVEINFCHATLDLDKFRRSTPTVVMCKSSLTVELCWLHQWWQTIVDAVHSPCLCSNNRQQLDPLSIILIVN